MSGPEPVAAAVTDEVAFVADRAGALLKMLPELSMLAMALSYASGIGATWMDESLLGFALVADAASLMAFATLVDVATRLRSVPPWWLGLLIGAGILLLNHQVVQALGIAWTQGAWVFVPFAWSLLERVRELWTLPAAPAMEKIRRRTLTFDRLYIAVALMMLWVITALGMLVVRGEATMDGMTAPSLLAMAASTFYAVAAFNAWRVHRAAFAKRPRSLVPWVDMGDAARLDPI